MLTWLLGGRVEASRRSLVLALGDGLLIALFVGLGEVRHAGTVPAGIETFAQFGIGWLLVAVAAGVYAPDALTTPRAAVGRGVAAWVVAAIIAQLVRLLMAPGSVIQPTFVLVSIGFGGIFIGGWRLVAARRLAGTT